MAYSNWGDGKPSPYYDFVRYQDDGFTKWDDTLGDHRGSTQGALCMKGDPLRWTYTQRFSMADYQRYAINGGGNTQVGKYASELVNFLV